MYPRLRSIGGVLVVLMCLPAWPAEPTAGSSAQERPAREAPAVVVTAGELADHPDRYIGRVVLIRADVADVYAPSVFTLDEDRLWSDGEDVLVVADGLRGPLVAGSDVAVTGEVRRYDEAEIRRRLAGHAPDVTAAIFSVFGRRPLITARSIRNQFGDELLTPPQGTQ